MEDLEDPVEILLPTRNRILILLLADKSRGNIPFTLLDSLPLNRTHGSAIGTVVSESLGVRVLNPTHVVNSLIASSTDGLSSSDCLPSNPRSRALHTAAQDRPRSTYSRSPTMSSCVT